MNEYECHLPFPMNPPNRIPFKTKFYSGCGGLIITRIGFQGAFYSITATSDNGIKAECTEGRYSSQACRFCRKAHGKMAAASGKTRQVFSAHLPPLIYAQLH